jgi:hypothetical protein
MSLRPLSLLLLLAGRLNFWFPLVRFLAVVFVSLRPICLRIESIATPINFYPANRWN